MEESRILRVETWASELTAVLYEIRDTPFEWGKSDCFSWTNTVVERLTGQNFFLALCDSLKVPEKDRHYKSSKGFKRLLKKYGVTSFYDLVYQMYGEPIKVSFARRGDVVMIEVLGTEQRPTLGICRGQDVMFKTLDGNALVPLAKCVCAWRVE